MNNMTKEVLQGCGEEIRALLNRLRSRGLPTYSLDISGAMLLAIVAHTSSRSIEEAGEHLQNGARLLNAIADAFGEKLPNLDN